MIPQEGGMASQDGEARNLDSETSQTTVSYIVPSKVSSVGMLIGIRKSERIAKQKSIHYFESDMVTTSSSDQLTKLEALKKRQNTTRKIHYCRRWTRSFLWLQANKSWILSYFIPWLISQVSKSGQDDKRTRSDAIYQIPSTGTYVIGDKRTSYGPWINDPLDQNKVNCMIKYNKKKKRLEVQVGPLDIQSYGELFICYGEDFWGAHLDKAPLEKIVAAYYGVANRTQHRNELNREGEVNEPPRKMTTKRTINRISR